MYLFDSEPQPSDIHSHVVNVRILVLRKKKPYPNNEVVI